MFGIFKRKVNHKFATRSESIKDLLRNNPPSTGHDEDRYFWMEMYGHEVKAEKILAKMFD